MSTKPNSIMPQWRMFGANKDVSFAVGMSLVLAVLFLPLPPILLDFGLALSLSLSVLIFMVALWIPSPLQFNSFPTLLLVTTMLRLSLNVASTRLILSEGHAGLHAAGDVIQGFSKFIVAGNFVIGVVIFAILVIINFVVITKGSTRIAEVAARFSLDAMPGKQMAIDADMGAGLIDEDEARRRRKELEDESAFFGAMDGASKFVRGDAVAGLIITLINVIGGILIGVVQRGMGVGDAFNVFTSLTIGDGLVSQIPALVVSLAAGLIVTKGGTRGAANEAVFDQLSNFPKALYMAAMLLFGIGLLPGFPLLVFALLAAAMVGLGVVIQRGAAEAAEAKAQADAEAQKKQDMPEVDSNPMHLDELRLVLGEGLVALANRPDAVLPSKIKSLRKHFAEEFGFPMPSVRIKDDVSLPINSYSFQIHGVGLAFDDPGLGATGATAEDLEGQGGNAGFHLVEQETAHGLVATGNQRRIDPGFTQPGLGGLAAQPAPEAIQITVRIGLPPLLPGLHALFALGSADQFVTQINGRLLAMLLVADADLVAFVVVDQGDIGGTGEGAFGKFHRGTHVQQGRAVQEEGQEIVGVVAHGKRV